MKTLYLHIGTHRTATSSIQAFLHANFGNLTQRGFLYPYGVKRHVGLFNKIFSGERQVADVAEDLLRRTSGKQHEIHSVVLSDEDVCMQRDLSRLAGFSRHFDVKVLFCLRRQDLWLESWFLQNVKWQWNSTLAHCTLEEFFLRRHEFHWADYDAYVGHLEQVFGQDAVIPYVFEKSQMPDGPVAAFAERIGLRDLETMNPAPHANRSLSPLISEFMRCLPLDEAQPQFRGQLERACAGVDLVLDKSEAESGTLLLDHGQRQEVLEEYAPGNARLARRHFGREVLFGDPLPAADAPIASLVLPGDSYELMSRIVSPFVRKLIELNAVQAAIQAKALAEAGSGSGSGAAAASGPRAGKGRKGPGKGPAAGRRMGKGPGGAGGAGGPGAGGPGARAAARAARDVAGPDAGTAGKTRPGPRPGGA